MVPSPLRAPESALLATSGESTLRRLGQLLPHAIGKHAEAPTVLKQVTEALKGGRGSSRHRRRSPDMGWLTQAASLRACHFRPVEQAEKTRLFSFLPDAISFYVVFVFEHKFFHFFMGI